MSTIVLTIMLCACQVADKADVEAPAVGIEQVPVAPPAPVAPVVKPRVPKPLTPYQEELAMRHRRRIEIAMAKASLRRWRAEVRKGFGYPVYVRFAPVYGGVGEPGSYPGGL